MYVEKICRNRKAVLLAVLAGVISLSSAAWAKDAQPAPPVAGTPGTEVALASDTAYPGDPGVSECLEFNENFQRQSFPNIGNADRSVAVDINSDVPVESLGIWVDVQNPIELIVNIRKVNGNVRAPEVLASASIRVDSGEGEKLHTVPIDFTFQVGTRYDIAFEANPPWGFNLHMMPLLFFNNPSLDPNRGFDVGPFKVLDGAFGGAYGNTLMPHVVACEGGACGDRARLKAACKRSGTKVIGKIKKANPNVGVTFKLDGGQERKGKTNNRGKAKAKWTNQQQGGHVVEACKMSKDC